MYKTIAFIWENFGPLHVDRCEAVISRGFDVIGIEFTSRSSTYEWVPAQTKFKKVTLFDSGTSLSEASLFRALVVKCYQSRAGHFFFCHYERPATLLSALAMRGLGRHVYMMNDSKFDDYPRRLWREVAKRQFFRPYQGCLAGSKRTQDYMRFLGMRDDRIARGYDTVSVQRMKAQLSDVCSLAVPFDQRHFTIVARLVEKKNHSLVLHAYRRYLSENSSPRRLIICGSGLLQNELKAEVKSLSLDQHVTFTGFIQTTEVSTILSSTLALILPSTEEQFGQVVLEAIALGVPVLVSEACGARDELVRTGVNGFVFEPDNPEGLALFMSLLASDHNLWMKMADATKRFVPLCDVSGFADGVEQLVSTNKGGVLRS